jgi:hypothetical protein
MEPKREMQLPWTVRRATALKNLESEVIFGGRVED